MKYQLSFVFRIIILLLFPILLFGQAPDLGTANNFALYTAAGQFENVGAATVVVGDVGTNVGAFLAFPPGTLVGNIYIADPVTAQAKLDVDDAYADLAGRICGSVIGSTLGNGQILVPNTYCVDEASTLNGNLTLDAQGDPGAIFIFQIGGAFSTSTFANVLLINGANLCNVYWQIGGAFTLGGGSVFVGTVIADGAINLHTGSTLNGRALSTAGAISISDNFVTMSLCQPPIIICAGVIPVSCEALIPAPDIASVTVTATCPGDFTITFVDDIISNQSCTNQFTLTRTYLVTDACGETATCEQTILVNDQTLPIFTACPGVSIPLGCNPPAITAAQAIAAAGAATDNCGTPTLTASGGTITGGCMQSQTWTVTATDACNNMATCQVTFTWNSDTQNPVFTNCPAGPINLGCNSAPPTAASAIAAAGAATDNCGAPAISAVGGIITGGCVQSQTWTVTAADICNNTATCLVTFIWSSDTQDPVFTNCPAGPINLGCIPAPPTAAQAIAAADPATDNCGVPAISAIGGNITGGCVQSQTWTVTATDICNNTAICLVTFTWSDSDAAPPTFLNCPIGPINLGCNPVPPTAASAILAAGPATDDCGDPVITAVGGIITGGCVQSQTWTVTATDICNNTAICLVTFTWSMDTQDPVFTNCPTGPVILGCIPTPPTAANAIAAAGPATDNCGMPTISAIGGIITGGCVQSQTWTVTATDICNNTVICLVTFTWSNSDVAPPTFLNCPIGPINLGCDPVLPTAASAILAAGPATDDCGTPVISAVGGIITGGCVKSQIWTVTATDICNSTVTCVITFTWTSDTEPMIVDIPDYTLPGCTNPSWPTSLTTIWTDNCGGGGNVVAVAGPITTNGCSQSRVYTFTVVGACGPPDVETTIVTRTYDVTKPVFSNIPPNVTVQCDAVPPPSVAPIATDNCDTSVTVTLLVTRVNGTCPDTYTLTRRWTAVDDCGNTRTASQRITVRDTQKPVFISVPGNLTIQCSDPIPVMVLPTATDNCDTSVTVTFVGQWIMNTTCPGNYQIMRSWSAVDNCGNSTVAAQIIQVRDTQAPTFLNVPQSVSIECNQPVPPLIHPTATDNCGGYVQITYLGQARTNGSCVYNFTLTRTWRAQDLCGNSTIVSQVITAQDTQPPVFVNPPGDITVECECYCVPFPIALATDNCGPATVTYLGEVQSPGDCSTGFTLTRTWVASDLCGHTSVHTQVIHFCDVLPLLPFNSDEREVVQINETPREFLLRPNPTSDKVQIDLSLFNGEAVQIVIFNEVGALVWDQQLKPDQESFLEINLRQHASLKDGVYQVVVQSGGKQYVKSLVLMH